MRVRFPAHIQIQGARRTYRRLHQLHNHRDPRRGGSHRVHVWIVIFQRFRVLCQADIARYVRSPNRRDEGPRRIDFLKSALVTAVPVNALVRD